MTRVFLNDANDPTRDIITILVIPTSDRRERPRNLLVGEFGLASGGRQRENYVMRVYADKTVCPDCKQTPKRNRFDGRWQCGCEGRLWSTVHGGRGDPEEHTKLTMAHFQITSDTLGDTYYVGPFSHIAWLYEDGTWRSEPDTPHRDLDSYLEYITASAA